MPNPNQPHQHISKIFVLMLENRSFDHMLGFSSLPGIDGVLDAAGKVKPGCSNVNANTGSTVQAYETSPPHDPLGNDPPHEFCDILTQLCGKGAVSSRGQYPLINNSGFIDSYSGAFPYSGAVGYGCGKNTHKSIPDPDIIMGCFMPGQVPILATLAQQYAVCDMWFSSLPGPTWPNRYYAHAASSSGLDGSPGMLEMIRAYAIGQRFQNGTIFDRLDDAGIPWEIFCGDHLPQSFAMHGMTRAWFRGKLSLFSSFAGKINRANYAPQYIFIEPDYGQIVPATFRGGNSQHPVDGIAGGEQLIRDVYTAIRNSPHWDESMLIITYDEHGGFYDHVRPGPATPPGDAHIPQKNNQFGFGFDQLGVRVPALVVSPYISPGTVSHTPFNHASIPATICRQFGLNHLTASDAAAKDLLGMLNPNKVQDGIASENMPDVPQAPHAVAITSLGDIPPDTPIKPITRGFLNVAVLKHQAIEGHNLEKDNFVSAVEQYGVEKPQMIIEQIATETSSRLQEIADRYSAIRDERSAQEYLADVIEACERHMANHPALYGLAAAMDNKPAP